IIAQSMEYTDYSFSYQTFPQYLLIDLESRNATQILVDIIAACDNTTYIYNRILYHPSMSTLVYYCTQNNSLLILDEEEFTVQSVIKVDVDRIFEETQLSSDGSTVVIIGMRTPLSGEFYPSQFIKIDLATKSILN